MPRRFISPLRFQFALLFCFSLLLAVPPCARAQQGAPLPAVIVRPVQVGDITDRSSRYARVEAINQVLLVNRVEGAIEKWHVDAGSYVQQGQLLLELDRSIYQARLAAAQAEVDRAEVARDRARLEEARISRLFSRSAVAESERDTALSNLKSADAALKSAQAARDLAAINLSYTRISAPFDGQVGTFSQHTGSYLTINTVVSDIVQLDPIRVVFSLNEAEALALMRNQAEAEENGQENGGDGSIVSSHYLEMPDGSRYPHQGRLEYVDNKIDPLIGMATVRARFPNPDRLLLPGQFVNLVTYQGAGERAPIIPLGSLLADANGSYVFIVNQNSAVERRTVQIRSRTETHAVIAAGLEGGELLVVDGIQKIRPGQEVSVTNAGPENSNAPDEGRQ